MTERRALGLALALLLSGAAGSANATERCAHYDPLRSPWFGDLHVHTTYSLDASTQGTRTTPAEAYRFARGERLGLHPFARDGTPRRFARLERPLDFAAVTDHAELLGETTICRTPGLPGHDSIMCRVYRGWPRMAYFLMNSRGSPRFAFCGPDAQHCLEAARGPWRDIQDAAEVAYDRSSACQFTSFVGYEWTKSGAGARNLHRNVIFRSDVVPEDPANALDDPTKEALWQALDRDCRRADGCEAVVIPHNSNLSGGLMFQAAASAEEARRRARHEPLVEIMQHKGASECRRSTAPADELCGFEELPYDRFMGQYLPFAREIAGPLNFTRHALALGLVQQQQLGANPFKFGIIASTDTHLGTPGLVVERADYPGHGGAGTPIGDELPEGLIDLANFNPGGLAVLWAEQNARDSLFDAMLRREAYGTSGPRLLLRFFGGWDYPADLCGRPDFAARGYAGGVPMGADLPERSTDAPVFAVWALRDPGTPNRPGTPLQRVQIIKAWVVNGEAREAVIEVAGDPGNGAGVDEATCTPRGDGFDQLCSVWRDHDFDPAAPALYYARAVENPTCRWSAWACLERDVDCSDPGVVGRGLEPCCDPALPRTVQERAWSSPIWYQPQRP